MFEASYMLSVATKIRRLADVVENSDDPRACDDAFKKIRRLAKCGRISARAALSSRVPTLPIELLECILSALKGTSVAMRIKCVFALSSDMMTYERLFERSMGLSFGAFQTRCRALRATSPQKQSESLAQLARCLALCEADESCMALATQTKHVPVDFLMDDDDHKVLVVVDSMSLARRLVLSKETVFTFRFILFFRCRLRVHDMNADRYGTRRAQACIDLRGKRRAIWNLDSVPMGWVEFPRG